MIRINSDLMRVTRDELLKTYLYMVARVLPFYPKDIFFEGYYYPDGKTKTDVKKFIRKSWKVNEKYDKRFKEETAQRGITKDDKERITALMAEEIIRGDAPFLHKFLYDESSDGHVIPERLRMLLTASFSVEDIEKLQSSFKLPPLANGNDQLFPEVEKNEELLEYVFRYDAFSHLKDIHSFVNMLGVEVCPYCNRQFTTTLDKKTKKLRSDLDHYLSKSQYPYFALSIWNLIPSCKVCNSIKNDRDVRILYPYEEEMGEDCVFWVDSKRDLTSLTGMKIGEEDITIQLKQSCKESVKSRRIKNSIETFALDDLYQSNKGYVLDLLRQKYIFSDEMIYEIANQYPDLFHNNENEVREMLILNKLGQDNLGARPLGKLTHDILQELDELYRKK